FLMAGEIYEFSLHHFEVLNLEADAQYLMDPTTDLSGTTISATQPIAVFGGHEEAVVGGECCAEHLEQQLFPVSTWGDHYFAVPAESRGGSEDVWRILASEDNTQINTLPPQPDGNDSFVLNRGQYRDITTSAAFEVVGSAPIALGQYLASQGATADFIGDPAFILAVPLSQLRESYTVLTPADYTEDWLTVVRPIAEPITLDGQLVSDTAFRSFGIGGYEYAWISVEDGAHTVEAAVPFALIAYGYSQAVSYGYPGGMNLRRR
ncbi:MAG: IgGFc-binding protein, partial [Gammaproteobacteria bacterium]|nr:IgGFc-binding protein [Gammaproteobacteria bacterium]